MRLEQHRCLYTVLWAASSLVVPVALLGDPDGEAVGLARPRVLVRAPCRALARLPLAQALIVLPVLLCLQGLLELCMEQQLQPRPAAVLR